jgi:hypothetical protein
MRFRAMHAYKAVLAEFSDRFVAGTDYGNGRKPLPEFLTDGAENLRAHHETAAGRSTAQHRLSQRLAPADRHALEHRRALDVGSDLQSHPPTKMAPRRPHLSLAWPC